MSDDGTTDAEASSKEADVVQAAAAAAEEVVFSRYDRTAVRDLDVTVTLEDDQLEVDVYLDAPADNADPEQVADDAALAARGIADEKLS